MNDYNDTPLTDDFEVEITDLEPDNRSSHLVAAMKTFHQHFSQKNPVKSAEENTASDDFELEISDLPPDDSPLYKISLALKAFGSQVSFKRRIWRIACSTMILILLVVLLNNIPPARNTALKLLARITPTSSSSSATTASSSSIAIVSGGDSSSSESEIWTRTWEPGSGTAELFPAVPPVVPENAVLGNVPENCPSAAAPRNFDSPTFPPGVGGPPLWVTGFSGSPPALTHLTRSNQPQLGWYQQILLVAQTDYAGLLSLVGENLQDGSPLWFGDPTTQYSPRKTIISLLPKDPSLSNRFSADQQWVFWPVDVYIPVAGCYHLVAIWGEEHWVVPFAAGAPSATKHTANGAGNR